MRPLERRLELELLITLELLIEAIRPLKLADWDAYITHSKLRLITKKRE